MGIRRPFGPANGRRTGGRLVAATLAAGGLTAALVSTGPAVAGAATTSTGMISTASSAKQGTYLVSGKTVYTLRASKTPCTSKCLKVWPMVVLPTGMTAPTAGTGVNAVKLGTVSRSGGVLQVTYGGKPLYWFVGDRAPGQVHGNITDKWGKWSTVVTVKPKSGSGASSAGTGGVSF